MSRMGRRRSPTVLVLIALLGMPASARAEERGPAATLTVLSAPVDRAGPRDERPAAAASGSDLAVGDRVVTGPEGRALITFLDGSTVTVEPASEVTVRQAEMEGREASRLRVLIVVGTVWARVAGWLGGRGTVTLESNIYSATAHDGLIGAQQDKAGAFVCWTRAGNVEVVGPSGVAARLQPGQKVTIAPSAAAKTEPFAVNRSTLEISTAGPVLPLVTMSDRTRRAGFVVPGIEVNQVFGSLTAHRPGDAWIVEVPGGFPGPYRILLTGIADGPFTVAVTGRVAGRAVYTRRWTGTIARGQRLGGGLTQDFDVRYTVRANEAEAFTGYISRLRAVDDSALGSVLLSPLEVAEAERR